MCPMLELGDGVFEVKSTNGDVHLGGDDFDMRIMNWLADEFKPTKTSTCAKTQWLLQRLKEASEKAKIELSSSTETEINLTVHHFCRWRARALSEKDFARQV
jgi:molecular chaperone DnaK